MTHQPRSLSKLTIAPTDGHISSYASHGTHAVYVARCDIGLGVFAARDFAEGTPILTLTGPIISLAQTLAKGIHKGNPLQIDFDRYIDLEPPGVYLNHSCDPNTAIVNDHILIALRAIQQHEELRFDYSTTMSGDGWTMECRCGAVACRRLVRDFEFLPPELQSNYLGRGLVQSFIAKRSRRA